MRPQADPTASAVVLPPRPNPGPEPWPEPRWPTAAILATGLVVTLLAAVAWRIARRVARSRRQGSAADRPGAEGADTPRDRLIRRAEEVRAALVAHFDASWAAKTTEEVAAAPGLVDWLGPERAEGVVGLLGAADRAKFAGEGPHGEDWDDRAAEILAFAAGATSRIKG